MGSGTADRAFFLLQSRSVARLLLGMTIFCTSQGTVRGGVIIETESYPGPQDKASHAYQGKRTARNQAEFLIGGHIYIYLVYGMYWQCNISTGKEGWPSCVLIRAINPTVGHDTRLSNRERIQLTNGPGKVCRWLGLSGEQYGYDITKGKEIWIQTGKGELARRINRTPRINIDYAGREWASRPLRYLLEDYQSFLAKPKSKWYK
ncbi:DNA-3-methyladenine glycosylase [Candidatus Uhrbacteria bacterium]|nr:DNA-3-methyladenine glycosylase [Candidatus Uhrbacteria bacterium]